MTSVVRQAEGLKRTRQRRQQRKAAKAKAEAKREAEEQQLVPATEEAEVAQAPPQTSVRSPGEAPRWRVSFIARQAVSKYFSETEVPVGHIMPSILLVYGTHARLENISNSDRWVQREEFEYQGVRTVREADQKVPGNLLKGWRQLRQKRPELFTGDVLVWSQPAAVCDATVYKYQQQLEATEWRQAIDLVDSFTGGWTEEGNEAAFYTQRLRCCVGAGTTGYVQPTDTALAAPAKAALGRYHTELRSLLQAKAAREQTACTYKVGPAEIMEAALLMHRQMLKLNEERQVVLRACRAGGWMHWRPNSQGKLEKVDQQAWAAELAEGTSKLSQDLLANRSSWVSEGQPTEQAEKAEAVKEKTAWQENYTYSGLFLQLPVDLELAEGEAEQIQELMLHPRDRLGAVQNSQQFTYIQ